MNLFLNYQPVPISPSQLRGHIDSVFSQQRWRECMRPNKMNEHSQTSWEIPLCHDWHVVWYSDCSVVSPEVMFASVAVYVCVHPMAVGVDLLLCVWEMHWKKRIGMFIVGIASMTVKSLFYIRFAHFALHSTPYKWHISIGCQVGIIQVSIWFCRLISI